MTKPGIRMFRGPKRISSFSEKPSERPPITTVVGKKASPTSSAL